MRSGDGVRLGAARATERLPCSYAAVTFAQIDAWIDARTPARPMSRIRRGMRLRGWSSQRQPTRPWRRRSRVAKREPRPLVGQMQSDGPNRRPGRAAASVRAQCQWRDLREEPDGGPAQAVDQVNGRWYCKTHIGAARAVASKRRDRGFGTCSVPGCSRPAVAREGKCNEHRAAERASDATVVIVDDGSGRGDHPYAPSALHLAAPRYRLDLAINGDGGLCNGDGGL